MTKQKHRFPVDRIRQFLEPGPVVLVTSQTQGRNNIMTMGWHSILEFNPSLVGCVIASGNHSYRAIRDTGECVINLPTATMVDVVAKIGNVSGADVDKFAAFGLTPEKAEKVGAPRIAECHAHFECRLHDDALVDKYNYFIFEVIAAQVAATPAHPQTLHYLGDGQFMVAGKTISRRGLFTKVS